MTIRNLNFESCDLHKSENSSTSGKACRIWCLMVHVSCMARHITKGSIFSLLDLHWARRLCLHACYQFSSFFFFFIFFYNPGCPGQFARTTTIPRIYWTSCKPSRQVRHHGNDKHTHKGSNSEREQSKPHLLTIELYPQVKTGTRFSVTMWFWQSLLLKIQC